MYTLYTIDPPDDSDRGEELREVAATDSIFEMRGPLRHWRQWYDDVSLLLESDEKPGGE